MRLSLMMDAYHVHQSRYEHSGRVRVAPFEFTSNGGRGEALSRRVKIAETIFYEVINYDKKNIQF